MKVINQLNALVLMAAALALPASAQLITPAVITASGSYNNSPTLIIDGFVPAETTNWQASSNVWWTNFGANFTIDLGGTFLVKDVLLSVDNNDAYQLAWSLDNVNFTNLFTIQVGDGEIPAVPGGMDTFSTDSTNGEYVAAIDFAPVVTRYLNFRSVSGGDRFNAVGEIQAFGVPVPEPSTYGLLGAAALAGIVALRRRKSAK